MCFSEVTREKNSDSHLWYRKSKLELRSHLFFSLPPSISSPPQDTQWERKSDRKHVVEVRGAQHFPNIHTQGTWSWSPFSETTKFEVEAVKK